MRTALRALAFALVLVTSGFAQAVVSSLEPGAPCAGSEAADGPCDDCATECGVCACCPLRATVVELPRVAPAAIELPATEHARPAEPTVALVCADIFHPPQA